MAGVSGALVMWAVLTIVAGLVFTPLFVAHPLAKQVLRMPPLAPATLTSVLLAVVEYVIVAVLQVVACSIAVVIALLLSGIR